ncbi:MAG: serine--tRNA ligase [Patescibacteria group bacterium]|jgi:seryl-tRNA synthetase
MIDIKLFRENPNFYRDASRAKNIEIDIQRIMELDRRVRLLKTELEGISAQKNEVSKRIPKATAEERKEMIGEMRTIDQKAETLQAELGPIDNELEDLLYHIPNPALADVKLGKNDTENEVLREVGKPTEFSFAPKDHLALGEALGIIDVEQASKVSASRFNYLIGNGAGLAYAIQQYAMCTVMKHGFTPVVVPHLVNARTMRAMGYLEHGGHDEIYYFPKDNLYLIGTAEQPLGGLHVDQILAEKVLPLRYVAFSNAFRREAGSYGKDTKGLIRMHEFQKIEMFSYTIPENSNAEHELLLSIEEELVRGLGVPYRVIKQCTGDLGLPAARKYDIECWMPTQNTYRETHSTSTCTDFQSRRLNTRYKNGEGETKLVHTLNGTAFAIGRILAVILENFQNEDGSITIPGVLRPYMGGMERIG